MGRRSSIYQKHYKNVKTKIRTGNGIIRKLVGSARGEKSTLVRTLTMTSCISATENTHPVSPGSFRVEKKKKSLYFL